MSEARLSLRDGDLEWREVEGELVVLDLRNSSYFATNSSGRVLWGALLEGASRDQLIDRLVEEFDIERSRGVADVDAFIAELESRDLLVTGQPDA